MTDRQSGLLKHSILLMAATQIGNGANLVFQVAMMRGLSREEYGVLATMMSMVLIVGLPLTALGTAVSHVSACLARAQLAGRIPIFVGRWMGYLLWPALLILAVVLLARGPMATLFQLQNSAPLMLTAVVMAGSLFMPLFVGAFQGLQAFWWMSLVGQLWGVVRMLAGVSLVYGVSATALNALFGQLAGVVVTVVVGWVSLRYLLRDASQEGMDVGGGMQYFAQSLVVLGGFTVLMNADIALVKHFFSAEDAGQFARAANIGRALVFLPMPIAGALFPKVVSMGESSAHDWKLLSRAVLYSALILIGALLCVTVLAHLIWPFFTRSQPDASAIRLLRWVAWAMAPLGLSYILLNFEMAQHRFRSAFFLIPLALGYVVGVALFHRTLEQVIAVLGVVSTLSLIGLLLDLPWRNAGRRPSPPVSES